MSSSFWRDVRQFHQLLNLAHDGVLTTTELTVTFPKVLEGTFGSRGTQLSPTQYKEALEGYLSRLYNEAYPDYFLRKLNRPNAYKLGELPPDPSETRSQLPLLLTHFEKDFIAGLAKEEEAVLQIDLSHSIKTLLQYYKPIDKRVTENIDKFLPLLIRGLINTTYLPPPTDSLKVVDLELYLEHTALKMEVVAEEADPNDFEKVLKLTKAHIPISGIRLLIVALCGFLYDCPKIKSMQRSAQEEPLKGVFDKIPNLLQPGIVINNDGVDFNDVFTAMASLSPPPQDSTNQPKQEDKAFIMKFAGEETSKTITASGKGNPKTTPSNSMGLTPLAAKNLDPMSSDLINIAFKYIVYAMSYQKYLEMLLSNPGTVYNPLIDDSTSHISEDVCNDAKKSEKEREVLKKIREEQIIITANSKKSKTIPIITSFSLKSLLNTIFRLFSHSLDITRSIVAINDYIGEITYGEDEDNDEMAEAEDAMMQMMLSGESASKAQIDSFTTLLNSVAVKQSNKGPAEPPSTGTLANKEETNRLMNAKWLFPIRASIDWSSAFTINQLVTTGGPSSRQMMLMGKLGQGTASQRDVMRVSEMQEEDVMVDRLHQYSMTDHLRSGRQ